MITVIVPAYNEADPLSAVLASMPRSLDGRRVVTVVVDDGSTDGTAEVASAHRATVIRVDRNRGKGAALKRGLDWTEALPTEAVVLMDSDGQHDPGDLGRIAGPVLAGDADVVVGSRYLADGRRRNTPVNRYAVRSATAALLTRLLDVRITDPFSGYRCLAPDVARSVELTGDRYESEIEIAFCAARRGCRLIEVPIGRSYGPRTSKMGVRLGPVAGRIDVVSRYALTIAREYVKGTSIAHTSVDAEAA